jgi:predicted RNA-binding Zn-ribbon protein involved in translation (DUF1610 family)
MRALLPLASRIDIVDFRVVSYMGRLERIAHTRRRRKERAMSRELVSGVYESLRARCTTCGETIAEHPYCDACGRPWRCGEAGWRVDVEDGLDAHRCPTCVRVANL